LQGHEQGKTRIVDDVWIGAHVTALPNVTIGISSVTGTWSVFTSDIPSFSIAAGVPLKVIKQRKNE
jgi:acetyltransferase-like isoleucine patch superfamily enzyme